MERHAGFDSGRDLRLEISLPDYSGAFVSHIHKFCTLQKSYIIIKANKLTTQVHKRVTSWAKGFRDLLP